MKIHIIQLTLLNFKGIEKLTIPFSEEGINISGDNATGKTTIFDSFLWLLFGKDSSDRKDFNIKTLDKHNKAIEKLPHEVEGVLSVDGKIIVLKRTYTEKWTKKRGTAVEEFTGHETAYFVDDLPCSQSEYNKKVSEICDEQLFKLITNPAYFPNQKKETQRTILVSMAGEVSNTEILDSIAKLTNKQAVFELTNYLNSGKSIEDIKKLIASKKKLIKDQLEGLPTRVDEVKRGMPETQDWEAISSMIAANEKEIESIEKSINDISFLHKEVNEKRAEKYQQLSQLQSERNNLVSDLIQKFSQSQTQAISYHNAKQNEFNTIDNEISRKERNIETLNIEQKRLESEIISLRSRWQSEFDVQLTFAENEFHCPTCKRAYDSADSDKKKEVMLANFNAEKQRKLDEISAKGLQLKKSLDEVKNSINGYENELVSLKNKRVDISLELTKSKNAISDNQPDYNHEASKDPKVIDYDNKIKSINELLSEPQQAVSDDELKSQKSLLQNQNKELNAKLALRDLITSASNRIVELEDEQKKLNQELADYERNEFTVNEFSKAKITEVEKRINSFFKLVKFKLFETQINGGENETCEATVNGVPYSDLNNAMRINAGLDIINALSNHHQVSAPIFIDNRESVSELIECQSQIINLFVVKGLPLSY